MANLGKSRDAKLKGLRLKNYASQLPKNEYSLFIMSYFMANEIFISEL